MTETLTTATKATLSLDSWKARAVRATTVALSVLYAMDIGSWSGFNDRVLMVPGTLIAILVAILGAGTTSGSKPLK